MLLFKSSNSFTLPETNSSPLKIGLPNRKVVFQPSIFRGHVSFREGTQTIIFFDKNTAYDIRIETSVSDGGAFQFADPPGFLTGKMPPVKGRYLMMKNGGK